MHRRILREAAAGRALLAATVLLAVGGGLAVVAQAVLMAEIIARAFLGGAALEQLLPLLAALLLVAVARAALGYFRQVAADAFSRRVRKEIRSRVFARILALGPAFATGERTGELIATALDGVEGLDPYLAHYLPQTALAALIPLTVLIAVLAQNWVAGVILLVTAGLLPYFMILLGRAAEVETKKQWGMLRVLSAHFLDVVRGMRTLQTFGRSQRQVEIIRQVSERHRTATIATLRIAFLSAFALELLASLSTAVVAVSISFGLLGGTLHFAQGLAILILVPEFYLPLRGLGSDFHAGLGGAVAAERIFALLDTPTAAAPTGTRRLQPNAPLEIRFAGVHYRYPAAAKESLAHLDLTWRKGEALAVVGPSGAGKSTLLGVLLRFVEPGAGEVTVDGVPLRELDLQWWRRQIAYVPQNPTLFPGTVAENIRLGRPDATMEEVEEAARAARAHDFVSALPERYETRLGEAGHGLSGGERQRIALARALLSHAPLLVLDEPTASLDTMSDAEVSAAIAEVTRGRRALIVAHRLSTAERAARIAVLSAGCIVEEGTPEELRRRGTIYRSLIRSYYAHAEVAK
jgi:ATP-binding cassette subfamily C protein CydD